MDRQQSSKLHYAGSSPAAPARPAGQMVSRSVATRQILGSIPGQVSKERRAIMSHRIDIRAILADPMQRRELLVAVIIATQAREGIVTTREQAEAAYDEVRKEKTR